MIKKTVSVFYVPRVNGSSGPVHASSGYPSHLELDWSIATVVFGVVAVARLAVHMPASPDKRPFPMRPLTVLRGRRFISSEMSLHLIYPGKAVSTGSCHLYVTLCLARWSDCASMASLTREDLSFED